ncbi:MAG: zf-HC2 domain-containing protein [Clostridiales bacterium]|nr:zf-HC2 domain-containing protein [Clostridiales bacterium]
MNRKKACRAVERNLVEMAENHLDKKTRQKLKEHLEQCERCARLSRSFSRAWQTVFFQEEAGFSPASLVNLMRRVTAYDEHSSRWQEILYPAWRFLRPALMTLLLLAGIFAGHQLGKISPERGRPEDSFARRLLGTLEDIPRGSVADFYISRQILEKEKSQ